VPRLADQVILICGGARGQGAAEARLCVEEGASVIIGDVLEAAGRTLAAQLGQTATFVPQDVTRESDWAAAVKAAEALGGLHGLINNAGIYQPRSLMETDAELFEPAAETIPLAHKRERDRFVAGTLGVRRNAQCLIHSRSKRA